MSTLRKQSTQKTITAGHVIQAGNFKDINIIRNFPPDLVAHSVWQDLCVVWSTNAWQKKSEIAARNRASADSSGKTSRHTGGSIGYDERRIRLKRKLGREPLFKEIFLDTHLTKKSKTRLWAEGFDINNLEGMEFCTHQSKQAYDDYLQEMTRVYGQSFTEDDPDVWVRVQADGRTSRVFGIRSSDLNYVVTGTPSSSYGIAPSYTEYRQSQLKVETLQAQLQTQFEEERRARKELQQQTQQTQLQAQQTQQQMQQMQETFQKQLNDFMSQWKQHLGN